LEGLVPGKPEQTVSENPSQPRSQVWWFTTVIPAIAKSRDKGSQSKVSPEQKQKSLPD
jgi:hypothetical protein